MNRLAKTLLCAVLGLLLFGCATGSVAGAGDTNAQPDTHSPADLVTADSVNPPDQTDPVDQADTGSPDLQFSVQLLQSRTESVQCPPGGGSDPQFLSFGSATVRDVVVIGTVHYAGTTIERFYVADKGGGPWSGLAVDIPRDSLAVKVGDVLNITAELSEFYCLTRLKVSDVNKEINLTGSGQPPEPQPVECSELASASTAEKYEGTLVVVSDVTVASHQGFGVMTLDRGCVVDDDLRPFGSTTTLPQVGTAYSKLIGVVTYGFGEYKILPRGAADLILKP